MTIRYNINTIAQSNQMRIYFIHELLYDAQALLPFGDLSFRNSELKIMSGRCNAAESPKHILSNWS